MVECKYKIPVTSTINLETGESNTEYIEVTKEQYQEYLRPLAKILADVFVKSYQNENLGQI